MRASTAALVLVVSFVSGRVAAQPVVDPDTAAARRHFDAGLELYGLDRYADAIVEFEQARRLKRIPAFDYNIGKCEERLERWSEAIAAYERFLAAAPAFAEETSGIRARIGVLRQRLAGRKKPPASPRAALRGIGIAALALGGGALVAGTGAYLSAYPDYADLRAACGPRCEPAQVVGVWNRVQRAEGAAIGLWSVAAVAAAVGIPLVVLSRPRGERLWISPASGGAALGAIF